jgi:hypothetical protein
MYSLTSCLNLQNLGTIILRYVHRSNQDTEHFHHYRDLSCYLSTLSFYLHFLLNLSIMLSFREWYINEFMQHVIIYDFFFAPYSSLEMYEVVVCRNSFVPFYYCVVFYGIDIPQFAYPIHSLEDILDIFCLLAILSMVAINIHVQVFMWM